MKIPLTVLGIDFVGLCRHCGAAIPPHEPHECASTYCPSCRKFRARARTVNAPPLARSRNGAILYDPLDAEYGQGELPALPSLPKV